LVSALALALTVELWAVVDLPANDPRSHGLSGLAWDDREHVLYAVADHPPAIVELFPDRELRHFAFGRILALPTSIDGEGISITPTGFLVADENGHILRMSPGGVVVGELPLPKDFKHFRNNRGIESLTTAPDGETILFANEETLIGDGPASTPRNGSLIRIIRGRRQNLDSFKNFETFKYLTDPIPGPSGDLGVSDITALSNSRVLVLERGFVPGSGNFVRVYESTLGPETPIAKRLVLDLADLEDESVPRSRAPQRNPILDNYEGMALGPLLPDGQPTLFMVSDDNDSSMQVPRLLVLVLHP
jgi:hypothetical protein